MKQQSMSIMIEENDPMQFIRTPFYFLNLMILFIPGYRETIYTIFIPSWIYCVGIENRLIWNLIVSCTKQCLVFSKIYVCLSLLLNIFNDSREEGKGKEREKYQ